MGAGSVLPLLAALADLLERFEDDVERLEAKSIADGAAIAARETFGPFADEDESRFYAAPGLSPEQTWERLAERVAAVSARSVVLARALADLSQTMIAETHGRIFGDLFPEDAGRFRGKDEQVSYSIQVGSGGMPSTRREWGTGGRSLPARLASVCDEFNASVRDAFALEEPRLCEDLVRPTIRMYCKILSAHPFLDGNGRVSHVLLQYGLVRIGLLTVPMIDYRAHQSALGMALRTDGRQSYLEMERLVADTIAQARVRG